MILISHSKFNFTLDYFCKHIKRLEMRLIIPNNVKITHFEMLIELEIQRYQKTQHYFAVTKNKIPLNLTQVQSTFNIIQLIDISSTK